MPNIVRKLESTQRCHIARIKCDNNNARGRHNKRRRSVDWARIFQQNLFCLWIQFPIPIIGFRASSRIRAYFKRTSLPRIT